MRERTIMVLNKKNSAPYEPCIRPEPINDGPSDKYLKTIDFWLTLP